MNIHKFSFNSSLFFIKLLLIITKIYGLDLLPQNPRAIPIQSFQGFCGDSFFIATRTSAASFFGYKLIEDWADCILSASNSHPYVSDGQIMHLLYFKNKSHSYLFGSYFTIISY
ncbi:hypothetical protein HMPREF1557_01646 [Streptococcus sobrinus W1703]|uniref:Uncharacterized protein n=1 Tax=Streptococcus sobrinus W1703 TaxID=1227275 RepID=U2J2T0_9STRE|nr:hypothetical protein HMPREF1557_01646 [Streptococcus sobrinus W1703]